MSPLARPASGRWMFGAGLAAACALLVLLYVRRDETDGGASADRVRNVPAADRPTHEATTELPVGADSPDSLAAPEVAASGERTRPETNTAPDPRVRIRCRFVDSRGDAIAGVRLHDPLRDPLGPALGASAAGGAVELALEPPAPTRLRARDARFAPLDLDPLPPPDDDGTIDLGELRLDEGLALRVTVVGSSGAPIADAEIQRVPAVSGLGEPDGPPTVRGEPWARTDAAGTARLDALPRGAVLLLVRAPEHAATLFEGRADAPPWLREVVLTLATRATLRGRIEGLPADGATACVVRATPTTSDAGTGTGAFLAARPVPEAGAARPDAHGAFAFEGLPSVGAASYVVRGWSATDPALPVTGAATAREHDDPLVLHWLATQRLDIEVRDARTGQRVPGATVEIRVEWGAASSSLSMRSAPEGVAAMLVPAIDAAQRLTIWARAPGYARSDAVRATPGRTAAQVVELQPALEIVVEVFDARTRAPVAAAAVRGTFEGSTALHARGVVEAQGSTDAAGLARLQLDEPRRGELRVTHPGYAPAGPIAIEPRQPGAAPVRVELASGGSLAIVVRPPIGRSPEATDLWFASIADDPRGAARRPRKLRTDAAGRLDLERLAPGEYRVAVAALPTPPHASEWTSATVRAGERTECAVAAPERTCLDVRLRLDDEPLRDATVSLWRTLDEDLEWTQNRSAMRRDGFVADTDHQGAHRFCGAPSGRYVLEAWHAEFGVALRREVELRSADERLDWRIATARVEGLVLAPDGAQAAPAIVGIVRRSQLAHVVGPCLVALERGLPLEDAASAGVWRAVPVGPDGAFTLRIPAGDDLVLAALSAQGLAFEPLGVVNPGAAPESRTIRLVAPAQLRLRATDSEWLVGQLDLRVAGAVCGTRIERTLQLALPDGTTSCALPPGDWSLSVASATAFERSLLPADLANTDFGSLPRLGADALIVSGLERRVALEPGERRELEVAVQ